MKNKINKKKKIDWIYINKFINYSFIYIFLFIWTFNIVLVGLTYDRYRFEVIPEDNYSKSFQVYNNIEPGQTTDGFLIPENPQRPLEWDKYDKVSQTEIDELTQYYNRKVWLSVICLLGLVLSSPTFWPKLKKVIKLLKEVKLE